MRQQTFMIRPSIIPTELPPAEGALPTPVIVGTVTAVVTSVGEVVGLVIAWIFSEVLELVDTKKGAIGLPKACATCTEPAFGSRSVERLRCRAVVCQQVDVDATRACRVRCARGEQRSARHAGCAADDREIAEAALVLCVQARPVDGARGVGAGQPRLGRRRGAVDADGVEPDFARGVAPAAGEEPGFQRQQRECVRCGDARVAKRLAEVSIERPAKPAAGPAATPRKQAASA